MLILSLIFTLLVILNRVVRKIQYKACVINLARRRDRLIEFDKHYTLPIKYEIVDAVDGYTLDPYEMRNQGILGDEGMKSLVNSSKGVPKRFHYELGSLGAIGCYLSHVQIWQNVVKEDIKHMYVFEDDAWVMGIDMKDIITRLAELPDDWHIYMIGQPHSILEGIPITSKSSNDLYRLTRFCGTHAYIINNGGAKWLLEKGMLFPIQQQIDSHLSELACDHGLNIYMNLNKPMYGVFSAYSDIQVNSSMSTWQRLRIPTK